ILVVCSTFPGVCRRVVIGGRVPRRGRIARGVAIGHAPGDRSLRRELGGAVPLGPDQTCAFEQLLTAAVLVAHVGLGVTEVTLDGPLVTPVIHDRAGGVMRTGVLGPVECSVFEALRNSPVLEAALLLRGGQPHVGDRVTLVRGGDRAGQMVRTGLLGPVDDAFLELLRLGALVSLDRVLLADGLAELVLRGVLLDLGLRLLGLLVVVLLIVVFLVVVLRLVVVLGLVVVLLVVVLRLVVILLVAGLFPGLENGVDRRAHLAQLRVEGVAGAVGLTQVTVSDEIRLRRLRDSVDRELPGDRRGHSIAGLLRRGRTVVGAQHGDAEGAGVVSGHVSADDGLRDVTAARLPETTVLVRDDVVADIVPA